MGHAEHFLRRLDRVADHHVELSLTLYRDQALLKEVLNRAELPPGIGRLAISLEDPVEGPFVIVSRDGGFVTCLAKGMLLGPDVALLTRPRLDAAIAKVERMRERMAATMALRESKADGVAASIFRRMSEDGLRFCREDAETLHQVWPLVSLAGVTAMVGLMNGLRTYRKEVAYLRFDKLKPHEVKLARAYGQMLWNSAHLIVFCAHEASDELCAKLSVETDVRFLAAQTLFELGAISLGMRSLWVLAQRPKQYIGQLKALRDDARMEMRTLREFGLGIVASASPKLRAEAMKALSRPIGEEAPPGLDATERYAHAQMVYLGSLGGLVHATLENEADVDRYALRDNQRLAAMLIKRSEPTEEETDAISEPIGRALLASTSFSFLGPHAPHFARCLAYSIPWLARAEAQELFLPREFAQILPGPDVDAVAQVMANYGKARWLTRSDPVKNDSKLGRNDPCACGSGKKFKRCCEK